MLNTNRPHQGGPISRREGVQLSTTILPACSVLGTHRSVLCFLSLLGAINLLTSPSLIKAGVGEGAGGQVTSLTLMRPGYLPFPVCLLRLTAGVSFPHCTFAVFPCPRSLPLSSAVDREEKFPAFPSMPSPQPLDGGLPSCSLGCQLLASAACLSARGLFTGSVSNCTEMEKTMVGV